MIMRHDFDLSDRILSITGNLEKYQDTGGTITAEEVRWLVRALSLCADEARHRAHETERLERELEFVCGDGDAPPPRPAGSWLTRGRAVVIDGGLA